MVELQQDGAVIVLKQNDPDLGEKIQKLCSYQKGILEQFSGNKIQSVCDPNLHTIPTPGRSSFAEMFRVSYDQHIPLCLSVDHVWLTILQGFSKHVEKNAEKLRHHFVDFEGQKQLMVHRDHFVFGAQDNDWAGVFDEFQGKIKEFIGGDNHSLLCGDSFSTTTRIDQTLYNLTLMDTMKSYFKYGVMTMCGIPKVKLLGKKEDWEKLIQKVKDLEKFELSFWIPNLVSILEKFLEVFDGIADEDFWNMCYKIHHGTGSGACTRVLGWINNFYPYDGRIRHLKVYQEELEQQKQSGKQILRPSGFPLDKVPEGQTETPFIWYYLGKEIPMTFHGGFCGLKILDGEFITTQVGWAVGERVEEKKNQYDIGLF